LVYTLGEFYLQFKDKGLIIERSSVVQELKIFLRNKKSGKDKNSITEFEESPT
jgi:hypothetical protein